MHAGFPTQWCGKCAALSCGGETVRRREFITVARGAAVAWPLTARAQQPERVRRIGVINAINADDPEWQTRLAAFHQGLQEAGWIVSRNVRVDYRITPSNPRTFAAASPTWREEGYKSDCRDRQEVILEAGDFVYIPAGAIHVIANASHTDEASLVF